MKNTDKGKKSKVTVVRGKFKPKKGCGKSECFVEIYFEDGDEITECKTCGKILDIK